MHLLTVPTTLTISSTIANSKLMGQLIALGIIIGLLAFLSCNKLEEDIAPKVNTEASKMNDLRQQL